MTDEALDPIPLSALQHWCYCPRQCALIHIEQVFAENLFTQRGQALHKRVDDPGFELRDGLRVERALPLFSDSLGLVGKADVSVPGREAVVARVEVAPGSRAGRHTHPGDEISYISEGEVDLLIDGQPPRTLKAGETFVVPAGVIHDAHNASNGTVKLIGVYVVEKGKPLATPAP